MYFRKLLFHLIIYRIMNLKKGSYFITGIDTDAGKTFCTAHLANLLSASGHSVITQKFIQTGCDSADISEDILEHRRLQNITPTPQDIDHTTCPIIFRLPASPHLAAAQENAIIDLSIIDQATLKLASIYDTVLIEGAGGLLVPITEDFSTADYIISRNIPTILVSSARLGSLNHTLLTLEYCRQNNIHIAAVLYNLYPSTNEIIQNDTRSFVTRYLAKHYPQAEIIDVPIM